MASGLSLVFDYTGLRDIAGQFARANETLLAYIDAAMADAAQRALAIAKDLAPKGATLAFSEGFSIMAYGERGFAIVTDNPELLMWIRRGTGIYGGGGPIVATNAAALVFGSDRWPRAPISPNFGDAFAFRSVKGQRANPWETEALDEALSQLTPVMQQVVGLFGGELGAI